MPVFSERRPHRLLSCLVLFSLLVSSVAGAEDVAGNGATLYASHCSACHRPLSRTDINDRPAKRIRSAISVFPMMSPLRSLSDAEVAAIAAVLATPPAPVTLR